VGSLPGIGALPPQAVSPGPGWATLRLPAPNQSEGDGLASDLTRTEMFSGRILRGSPSDPATRSRYKLSSAEEDTGGASKQDGHSKLRGFWGHRVRRVDPVLSRLNEGAGAV
jgi:hypothetical protein